VADRNLFDEIREGSEGAIKRGEVGEGGGGRGSEGRARNDADTTLHHIPFASFKKRTFETYLNYSILRKKSVLLYLIRLVFFVVRNKTRCDKLVHG